MPLAACILLLAAAQEQEPIIPVSRPGIDGRGRDPWVFRAIFEDRSRMVVIAPRPDAWLVFNPETCAIHRIWRGKVDFRGKVWDFSQDNSRAEGQTLYAADNEIIHVAPDELTGWTADNVTVDGKAWKFSGDNASLTSPEFSIKGWQRVFLYFDEQSRKGRFRIEISDNGGRTWDAQWFESALSVGTDADWQWNFKRIEVSGDHMRIRIVQPKGSYAKHLRAVRMFGDRAGWSDLQGHTLPIRWRGYDLVGRTKAVHLRYDVITPRGAVHVVETPELRGTHWTDEITITGLNGPPIVRNWGTFAASAKTNINPKQGLEFSKNGTKTVQMEEAR